MKPYDIHFKLQLVEGLNVDPVSFNPTGRCLPGGLYFSREDIFSFVDDRPWIREVTLPLFAKVYEEPEALSKNYPKKWKADSIILGPRRFIWDINTIKSLLDEGANRNDMLLVWAAQYGRFEALKFLIENGFDVNAKNGMAFRHASRNGYLETVKYFVEHGADIHLQDDMAFQLASEYGRLDVVKYLVEQGANTHVNNDYAIIRAEKNEWKRVVAYLKEIK